MAPAKPVFGTAGLALCGWVLMVAGIGKLQHMMAGKDNSMFRNFPIMGIQDLIRGTAPAMASSSTTSSTSSSDISSSFNMSYMLPYTGVAFSYVWWMVAFQFVIGVLFAGAAAATPKLRLSAIALVTVLTTSCFLLTESVCNAYYGAYMLTHNLSGTPASVTKTDGDAQHLTNAIMVLFSGAVVCSVANALTLVFLGVAAAPAEAAAEAPEAKAEAVAAPVEAEAPAAAAEAV